jgi:hypothetical protein
MLRNLGRRWEPGDEMIRLSLGKTVSAAGEPFAVAETEDDESAFVEVGQVPLMCPSGLVRGSAWSRAVSSLTSSGCPAGGQPVDRRLWTVHDGVARVNLLHVL